jgi:hypothetical protein
MSMGPNVIQHKSNDGLAINEQNRISQWCNLQRTHCKRIEVKRILRYLNGTTDFALTCGGQGGLEARAHPICGCRWWNKPTP